MIEKEYVSPVSEDERNGIKERSAHALPDSPRDYGMRAGQVKPAFWKPLVQGEESVVGVINRVIRDVNRAFGENGDRIHFINRHARIGGAPDLPEADPLLNVLYYSTPPRSGDLVLTSDYDVFRLSVEDEVIAAELLGNIKGLPGATVQSVKKTSTSGLVDTYTMAMSDGSAYTFTVKNGKDGAGGEGGGGGTTVLVGGAAAATFDADTKVDKVVSSAQYDRAYVVKKGGGQGMVSISGNTPRQDCIPTYAANGKLYAGHPIAGDSGNTVATKGYVEDVVSSVAGSGSGGAAADPRKTTLLCDITLGTLHVGEGNYEFIGEAPLADTILPNEVYMVNGIQVTAGNDGVVFCGGEYIPDVGNVDIELSGNTVKLVCTSGEPSSIYPFEMPVKVVGLGAFTCLAQFPVVENGVTRRTFSLDPFSTVYIQQYNGEIKTVMADQNGSVAKTQFAVGNHNLGFITIGGGELTLDVRENEGWFDQYYQNTMLSLWTDVANIGATGGSSSGSSSSGSSGSSGGRMARTYYVPEYTWTAVNLPLVYGRAYVITAEEPYYDLRTRIFVWKDGYVQRDLALGNNFYGSVYFESETMQVGTSERPLLITVEEVDSYTEISCFIGGTRVLLRDPVTLELYEKPIEQVLPFEYAAFWNPAKGRIDATRVLAPPIVGDAEEYDRLYFDDGTVLNVYGVQFFWSVDTDTLVDWAKMEPGTRVCTAEGDIVSFVRSEHIVPEAPVKHYTLLTMRGRYIADGIVAGDKRDLIYARMMAPERKRYWRMLNEVDQANIKRAHDEGMKRRNWRYSRELYEALSPLQHRKKERSGEIEERKRFLADTDHRVIKFTEGVISEEAFAPDREARARARLTINEAEAEILTVDEQIEAETERVRAEIAATWKPKYAGRFVGKNKVILEDET